MWMSLIQIKFKIPCNKHFWGCSEETLIEGRKKCTAVCIYQQELCPIVSHRGTCSLRSPIKCLRQHILTGHKDCRVTIIDEETITITDKRVTQKLVLIRRHTFFVVTTHFSLPSHFSYYCVRAQYFGPKRDFPSYKLEITLGGASKHNAELECRSGKKHDKITECGMALNVSPCLYKDFF